MVVESVISDSGLRGIQASFCFCGDADLDRRLTCQHLGSSGAGTARCVECRRRSGLTLLELLVASLLATMLMGTLVGFLGLLERQRKNSTNVGNSAWRANVEGIIERDLIGARQIAFHGGRLTLMGHALDDSFSVQSPLETIIELRTSSHSESQWMTRTTRRIGQSQVSDCSLICGRVLRWQVERVDDQGVRQPLSKELAPSPRRLSIRIWFTQTGKRENLVEWLFVAN